MRLNTKVEAKDETNGGSYKAFRPKHSRMERMKNYLDGYHDFPDLHCSILQNASQRKNIRAESMTMIAKSI